MVTIGNVSLSAKTPRIAASFWQEEQLAQLPILMQSGLDIAEIRLDLSATIDDNAAQQFCRKFKDMPTILTLRPQYEGGHWRGSESARYQRLCSTMPYCHAVDIELSAHAILVETLKTAHQHNKTVIVSRHNFNGANTYSQLLEAMQQAFQVGADIFKCACLCLTAADYQGLIDMAEHCQQQAFTCIIIGMDDGSGNQYARRARRDLPRRGSCLAFAAVNGESAPGQLSLSETVGSLC